MLVNGTDVSRYSESFDDNAVSSVLQYLEVFKCCEELMDALSIYHRERLEGKRVAVEQAAARRGKTIDRKIEPPRPTTIVGACPKCGSPALGMPIPGCHTKATGRTFYKECKNCTWYAETVKTKKGVIEVEGE